MRPVLRGLYAVTPDTSDTSGLLLRLEQALRGGVRLVQYRNKLADATLKGEQAAALLSLCRRHQVPFLINDDLELALALGADGAHLGREDAPVGGLAAARAALGSAKILGVSCYNELARAREAAAAGADYAAFGALFPSPTKPAALAASLDLFGQARRELGCGLCGIGGITLENAPRAIAAGADLLAVITDLFDAPDVEGRGAAYARLFKE
ncbi:MAG: thiamine phosphate synthase [Rhodocyclaceae bacterium]|nr:thiamine phosphate synthase [Rhodocyclaceae bacterium]